MREFLYKNSFFRYAAAINSCGGRRIPIIAPLISSYAVMLVSITSGIGSMNAVTAAVAIIACLLFFAAAMTGAYRNCTPNLSKLLPISGKRKWLYDNLIVFFYTFIGLIIAVVIIGIIFLIVWLALTISGGGESVDETEDSPFMYNIGVYGGIFSAAYVVILYSAGLISGYLKSRKQSNIFLAGFVVALVLGLIFTGLPYYFKGIHGPEQPLFCSPFIQNCYEHMAVPWLCSLLWGLVAAGIFAAAIYSGLKYHKPKKY